MAAPVILHSRLSCLSPICQGLSSPTASPDVLEMPPPSTHPNFHVRQNGMSEVGHVPGLCRGGDGVLSRVLALCPTHWQASKSVTAVLMNSSCSPFSIARGWGWGFMWNPQGEGAGPAIPSPGRSSLLFGRLQLMVYAHFFSSLPGITLHWDMVFWLTNFQT